MNKWWFSIYLCKRLPKGISLYLGYHTISQVFLAGQNFRGYNGSCIPQIWFHTIWLVVWNMNFIFPYGNVIIPTDDWRTHIFKRGRYTTSYGSLQFLGTNGHESIPEVSFKFGLPQFSKSWKPMAWYWNPWWLGYPHFSQWIGLRENLQETMVLTIKYRGFL